MHEPVEKKIKCNSSGKGSLKLTNKTAVSIGGSKKLVTVFPINWGIFLLCNFGFFSCLFLKKSLKNILEGI